jgi:uncharacterized protein YuzE
MNKVFYDKNNDILSIHKGFRDKEKFKTNIDMGSIILDLSNKGRIIGLELIDATNFFKKSQLDIINADFDANITSKNILIKISLKTKNAVNNIPTIIALPLEKPVLA